MKYIPGNTYINTIVATLSETISALMSGLIVKFLGPSYSFTTTNLLAGVATIFLWVAETHDHIEEVPIIILLAKFGNCAFFSMLYMNTLVYFPSRYLGAVFGVYNTVARAVTILSPMVAELPSPVPELSIIVTCLFAALFSRCLKIPDDMKNDE